MKALVGAFNQEKALVGAFSVIVKTDCETDGAPLHSTTPNSGCCDQVLRTIPWHKVDIEVVSVETNLAGVVMEGSRQEILDYMRARGYTHRRHLSGTGGPGRPVKDSA